MIGIEFRRPRSMRLRAQWSLLETMRTGLFTQLVIVPLFRDHGILTQVAGDHQNVLKILPPLITTEPRPTSSSTAFDDVLNNLERSIGLLARRRPFARPAGTPSPRLIPSPRAERGGGGRGTAGRRIASRR